MSFANIARKAIRWLIIGVRGLRKNRELSRALIGTVLTGEKVQKRVESFFDKLAKIEMVWGEHTNVWKKVADGKKAGGTVTLTREEVHYLFYFKRGFDDTIKPIGKKIVDKLGLDGVDEEDEYAIALPDTPEVPDITPEEEDDGNLELEDGPGKVDVTG